MLYFWASSWKLPKELVQRAGHCFHPAVFGCPHRKWVAIFGWGRVSLLQHYAYSNQGSKCIPALHVQCSIMADKWWAKDFVGIRTCMCQGLPTACPNSIQLGGDTLEISTKDASVWRNFISTRGAETPRPSQHKPINVWDPNRWGLRGALGHNFPDGQCSHCPHKNTWKIPSGFSS